MKKKVSEAGVIAVTVVCAILALSACQSTGPGTDDLVESAEGAIPGMEGVDLASAAEKLGIPTEELTDALGTPPDVAAAAEKLGISKESLMEALGV